jgi:TolB-like protein/Flp pilus assembly protein TadD
MGRNVLESFDSMGRGHRLGGLRLEADGKLLRGDAPVVLPPQELKALRILLEYSGRAVSYAQLRVAIGDDARADSESLARVIASLQERIEPYAKIETVYKRGYRLVDAHALPHADGVLAGLPRLAILPLATGFSVPEYLGYAVAEEAAAQLGRARHAVASIVAPHAVFLHSRRGLSPQNVGSLLEADLVLMGSIRALPAHCRLEVRMIRVSDGSQLWSADLLVENNRLGGLERELVDMVTFRLQQGAVSIFAEVENDESDNDPAADALRREAWENYQQAHQEWQTLERHHMQDAQRRLTRAMEIDPKLVAARVDLAHLCVAQCILGYMAPGNAAAVVKGAATAGGVPPSTPESMLPMLGWVNFHMDRDLPAALRSFALSAHLPGDPEVALCRTMVTLSRHRMEEAVAMERSAMQHDPWSPQHHGRLIWALHLAGKAEESVAQAVEATARFPDHAPTHIYAAIVLAHTGKAVRAEKLARELSEKSPYSDVAASVHAYTLACAGREADALDRLERLHWLSKERFVLTSHLAPVYAALREFDSAVEQLRAANKTRCPWFFQMLADPRLKPLHGHPEFQAMQEILPAMEAAAAGMEAST